MKVVWVCLALLLAVAVIYGPDIESSSTEDVAAQQAAVQSIRQAYEPSIELALWNPDFSAANWVAVKYPKPLCAYDDCYQVSMWVDVMPNGDKKTIRAIWITYARNKEHQADNEEARTLFVEKSN